MRISKKILFLLLLIFILVGCKKNNIDTLTVGVNKLNGNFIEGLDDVDPYVCELIHGYGTLIKTESGKYQWDDKIVLTKNPEITVDFIGHKTYKFTIRQDLEWNNGKQITAKDYIAYILLYSSKEWNELADSEIGNKLLGYHDYRYGAEDTSLNQKFTGVRLINDYQFALTIDKENIPYFYEATFVSCKPISLEFYLPGFDIKDDGDGAYLIKSSTTKTISRVLENAVTKMPQITCGPYNLISFKKNVISLKINSYYKGNYQEKKPSIEFIDIKQINEKTELEQVIAGTIDLITAIDDHQKIKVALDTANIGMNSYLDNGFTSLGMINDWGPTQYREIRRAIAFLIDRNKILGQDAKGHGEIINGPYSKAYWFYSPSLDSSLTSYTENIEYANVELNKSPYKYEQDGVSLFDPEKAQKDNSYYRYDKEGNKLSIKQCIYLQGMLNFVLNMQAWKVGIDYQFDVVSFDLFVNHYYDIENRNYHLYELSISFADYDPYLLWHSDFLGTINILSVNDQNIDKYSKAMHEAGDDDEFSDAFVKFSEAVNNILPFLPLYSNTYYDIFHNRVKGIKTNAYWNWAHDICDIYIDK